MKFFEFFIFNGSRKLNVVNIPVIIFTIRMIRIFISCFFLILIGRRISDLKSFPFSSLCFWSKFIRCYLINYQIRKIFLTCWWINIFVSFLLLLHFCAIILSSLNISFSFTSPTLSSWIFPFLFITKNYY